MNRVRILLNEFKYSNGTCQFFLFGIWTVICSGMFPLSGYLPTLSLLWLLSGVGVVVTTLSANRAYIRGAILSSISLATIIGSVFFSYALTGGDMRADMQTPTVALTTIVIWGLYLGNLCSRQIWDKEAVSE